MPVHILAIESSCDETSAAVICDGTLRSNVTATQSIHEKYGGVVPELASREHLLRIIPVVDSALQQAGTALSAMNAIAYTAGPGLIGSLLVGSSFAKSLALAANLPLITVHHMQAHILAHFISDRRPSFPFICLTVSGGHTQLVLVKDYLDMEVIGETRDDAAGEAFDKTAALLNLPYPGGPLIDRYAREGNPKAFHFPEPVVPHLDFSFSGLKTSIRYFLQDQLKKDSAFVQKNLKDICASVQHRIVTMLLQKLGRAASYYNISHVAISGGVSANTGLRKALQDAGEANGWNVFIPEFEYCTDNAGMIAVAAYYKFLAGETAPLDSAPSPSLSWC